MEPAKEIPTGLDNATYDVVLVLQQAAEDVVRYESFAADAERAGDEELRAWFAGLADSDRDIVRTAVGFLRRRLPDDL